MIEEGSTDKARAEARRTIKKLQAIKVKWWWPFGWFKAVRYQNKILCDLVALTADCMENGEELTQAMETNAAVDTVLEQRIQRCWVEVYGNEENRRTLEQRVEAIERNMGINPHREEEES